MRWMMALFLVACGGTKSTDTSDSSVDGDVWVCDPVGADPVMGGLLNAPLADDVEVIVKTPQHPGVPGPEGLL